MYNIEVQTKDGKIILHREYQVFEFEQFESGGFIYFQKKIIENDGHVNKSVKYPLASIKGFTVTQVERWMACKSN